MDLFDAVQETRDDLPLAERMRPTNMEEFLGQQRVVGATSLLRGLIQRREWIPNMVFWGPPGTGKTTLAHILAKSFPSRFLSINAVDTGSKELKSIGEEARYRRLQSNEKTIVFIDEIHRLNRSQQDVLLPAIEKGDFTLIGATTENPSYELNTALLSRCRVLIFERLDAGDLERLLERTLKKFSLATAEILSPEAVSLLVQWSDGDARKLLGHLEQILKSRPDLMDVLPFQAETLKQWLEKPPLGYDKSGDEHYDCISAFIKSVRGSDPDAAIYYLARMLAGGEDPKFIARRLVISASEDIGNADPRALPLAVAGFQAVELIGLPEAAINLAQVTTYLAGAPKSNRAYLSLQNAKEVVAETGRLPVPKALRSAQTSLTRQLGHGKDYRYAHEGPKGWQAMEFLPEELRGRKFYDPADRGFEKTIRQYLDWMKDRPPEKE